MDTHKNARLTPKGREEMVRAVVGGGLGKAAAALAQDEWQGDAVGECPSQSYQSLRSRGTSNGPREGFSKKFLSLRILSSVGSP
jgi:hypothetical protein